MDKPLIFDGNLGVTVLRKGGNDYPFADRRSAELVATYEPQQLSRFISSPSVKNVYGVPQATNGAFS